MMFVSKLSIDETMPLIEGKLRVMCAVENNDAVLRVMVNQCATEKLGTSEPMWLKQAIMQRCNQ